MQYEKNTKRVRKEYEKDYFQGFMARVIILCDYRYCRVKVEYKNNEYEKRVQHMKC